jgi:ubiquitin carboxyl-terminal hydrolase L3
MKQYAQNACGTIGLFHIVLNALKNYPDLVEQNSYLWNFRNQVEGKNADEKGKIFKENKSILQEHKDASSEGQSECK